MCRTRLFLRALDVAVGSLLAIIICSSTLMVNGCAEPVCDSVCGCVENFYLAYLLSRHVLPTDLSPRMTIEF